MSHFSVGVIHNEYESVEELLAPYQENNMGDCPEEYLEFSIEIDAGDMEQEAKRIFDDYAKSLKSAKAKCKKENKNPEKDDDAKRYVKCMNQTIDRISKKEYKDICQDYHGGEFDEDGNLGYLHNLNSRWDWYSIGGRWNGMLMAKKGKSGEKGEPSLLGDSKYDKNTYDSIKIKDIDFDEMRFQYYCRRLKNWKKMLNYKYRMKKKGKKQEEIYKDLQWRYGIDINKDTKKSDYVDSSKYIFDTLAVLDDDGWHEPGEMGWFGVVGNRNETEENWEQNYYNRFIKPNLKTDKMLSIVDCHI